MISTRRVRHFSRSSRRGGIFSLLVVCFFVVRPGLVSGAQSAKELSAAAKVEAEAEAAIQGNLGHPYSLPKASRARMHACGVEWQKMKLSGAAAEKTWRFFGSQCLAKSDDKAPAPGDYTDAAK